MLIIDTNALAPIFDKSNVRHPDYRPVLEYLVRDRGIVAIGGSKYLAELSRLPRILAYLLELRRAGQIRDYDVREVDAEEARIANLAPPPSCDDQHLIALVSVSRARVVATDDRRADAYLRDRSLYRPGVRRPSIYRSASHLRLLRVLPRLVKRR